MTWLDSGFIYNDNDDMDVGKNRKYVDLCGSVYFLQTRKQKTRFIRIKRRRASYRVNQMHYNNVLNKDAC